MSLAGSRMRGMRQRPEICRSRSAPWRGAWSSRLAKRRIRSVHAWAGAERWRLLPHTGVGPLDRRPRGYPTSWSLQYCKTRLSFVTNALQRIVLLSQTAARQSLMLAPRHDIPGTVKTRNIDCKLGDDKRIRVVLAWAQRSPLATSEAPRGAEGGAG